MDIKVKADELLESGEAYLKICKEIEDTITKVYEELDHVFGEGSWQGFSASKYYESIPKEKEEMEIFIRTLKEYGEILKKYGTEAKRLTSKYRRY